jgi:hypothetical protein
LSANVSKKSYYVSEKYFFLTENCEPEDGIYPINGKILQYREVLRKMRG